jgi:hypothetical protein
MRPADTYNQKLSANALKKSPNPPQNRSTPRHEFFTHSWAPEQDKYAARRFVRGSLGCLGSATWHCAPRLMA